jgi:hypothetical protein
MDGGFPSSLAPDDYPYIINVIIIITAKIEGGRRNITQAYPLLLLTILESRLLKF